MTKTMREYQQEVLQWVIEKGWDNPGPSFPEAVALLHSEVSEALEEYRVHGLTAYYLDENLRLVTVDDADYGTYKPEGVPSELADIFIRLCDDTARWNVPLSNWNESISGYFPPENNASFVDKLAFLHRKISNLLVKYFYIDLILDPDSWKKDLPPHRFFQTVFDVLSEICFQHQIDLFAEYEAKMTYNKTREYRHGGKKL